MHTQSFQFLKPKSTKLFSSSKFVSKLSSMESTASVAETLKMSKTLTFEDGYFSNAVLRLHINAAVTIIFDIFVGYLVLYKSPKSMGSYKYYLLNIIVSSLILDLHLALFFVPVPLFPAIGLCSEGITKGLGRTFGGEIHMVRLFGGTGVGCLVPDDADKWGPKSVFLCTGLENPKSSDSISGSPESKTIIWGTVSQI